MPLYDDVDQWGERLIYGTRVVGQWVHRIFPLGDIAGKTIEKWMLIRDYDAAGDYKAAYKDIRVTNGAGVTRQTIWASGEPAANTVYLSDQSINGMCGPSNSFQVNIFDTTGARVATPFQYSFQGV